MRIGCELREGVLRLTLDRPDKLNAMTDRMWADLRTQLTEGVTEEVRVVVLTGAGEAFCAGSDVGGLLGDLDQLADRMRVSNACVQAVRGLGVPVVAAVDGVAAGSGANLALACDFVVATERARFIQVFIRRGLSVDSGASWLLPRLVGPRRALELALLGDQLDATKALDWGLINRMVPVGELAGAVDELTERLVGFSAAALAGTKRLLDQTRDGTLAEALEAEIANQVAVIATPEATDAISGFGSH